MLVDGARMPRGSELPDNLLYLTRPQAELLREASFDADVAKIAKRVDDEIKARRKRGVSGWAVGAVAAVALAGGLAAGPAVLEPLGWYRPANMDAAATARIAQLRGELSDADAHARSAQTARIKAESELVRVQSEMARVATARDAAVKDAQDQKELTAKLAKDVERARSDASTSARHAVTAEKGQADATAEAKRLAGLLAAAEKARGEAIGGRNSSPAIAIAPNRQPEPKPIPPPVLAGAAPPPSTLKPVSYTLRLRDPGTGFAYRSAGVEAKLAAECGGRDSVLQTVPNRETPFDITFTPARTGQTPRCLVLQPRGNPDEERCITLSSDDVRDPKFQISVTLSDELLAAAPKCPQREPLLIVFQRPDGTPHAVETIRAIAPNVMRIANQSIAFDVSNRRYQASLTPRHFDKLNDVGSLGGDMEFRGATRSGSEIRVSVDLGVIDLSQLVFEFREAGQLSRSCAVKLSIPRELRGAGLPEQVNLVDGAGGSRPNLSGNRAYLRVPKSGGPWPQLTHADERSAKECYFDNSRLEIDELRSGRITRNVGSGR